jgi:hypothetical protein
MNSRRDPRWSERVRPIIRARLEAGLLPTALPLHSWAAHGLDKPCDACNSLIERDDTEFELDFPTVGTLRFHNWMPHRVESGAGPSKRAYRVMAPERQPRQRSPEAS